MQYATISQTKPAAHLSPKYGFASTALALEQLERHGWTVSSVQEAKVRNATKLGFQRHMIRLDNSSMPAISGLSTSNSSRVQLCLMNSHDGSSAYRLFIGVLRMACLNGIVAGNSIADFRLSHTHFNVKRFSDGIGELLVNVPKAIEAVQTLQNKTFTADAWTELCRQLVDLRLKNVHGVQSIDYSTIRALRADDTALDAYTRFNVLQEKLMRGGLAYQAIKNIKGVPTVSNCTTRRVYRQWCVDGSGALMAVVR